MSPYLVPGFVRRLLWRLGRRTYSFARGEMQNDPRTNGEYWLLDRVLTGLHDAPVLLDVGANLGNWTAHALDCSALSGPLIVHAFEPVSSTRALLSKRLREAPGVRIHAEAVSDHTGETTFYSSGAGAGTSSLNPASGDQTEVVKVTTLDAFFEQEGIASATMVKIDAEGFDFPVLKGAAQLLKEGRIEVLQFEYNWRWLLNHACLRDVFDLILGRPYTLGKLVGNRIELYGHWHFELDRYFENNYVLFRNDSRHRALGTGVRFNASNVAVPT